MKTFYYVAYLKDGDYLSFDHKCQYVSVEGSVMCFYDVGSYGQILGIVPIDSIYYVYKNQGE